MATTTATPLMAGDPAADAERLSRLRQMKGVALGLLAFAAVVYVLTLDQDGVLGFVNAGAEASMVGAMADWFAVTALFRHPLGLPVPHTALVPRKKDELGRSLEEFFAENFLQEQVVRDRLAAAGVVRRLATWLDDRGHADRVAAEGATVVAMGLRRLRDDDVEQVVREVILPRFAEEPVAPLAGAFLAEVVRDGSHHGLVDLVLEEAHDWLVQHEDEFTDVVASRAPWWAPERVNSAVVGRLHLEAIRWVAEIRRDPRHQAREALDSFLRQLSDDLQHDPDTQERTETLKRRLLGQPQLVRTGMALWASLRTGLLGALDDETGPLRRRAGDELVAFGQRLQRDDDLRERLEGRAADLVVFAVERYGQELTSVITATIERWDGHEAARRIELHVGRDLQFIRINGTIVGGLVGVVIHAVTLVL